MLKDTSSLLIKNGRKRFLLRLRITQKALLLSVYFFFSFSSVILERLAIDLYLSFSRSLIKTRLTSTRLFWLEALKKNLNNVPVVAICYTCGPWSVMCFILFTATGIHSIRKRTSDSERRFKAQREIELISKKVWGKKTLFKWRNRLM